MKNLISKMKIFFLKKIYIWNYCFLNKQIPSGILVYHEYWKYTFFYPDKFGQALHSLTGEHIYMEKIAHYEMKPLYDEKNCFMAWCWRDKNFFFFAPVGGNKIFMALTRQFNCHHQRKSSLVLYEEFNRRVLIRRIVLQYKINTKGFPFPLQTVLEEKNRRMLLSLYQNEHLDDILRDIRNINIRHLDYSSLKRLS